MTPPLANGPSDGIFDTIGNTPAIKLRGDGSAAVIWVKLESANPTGSMKDRIALAMVRAAEQDGRLAPGQPVVEYTGGSTGSSLALVCTLTGHPLWIATSDAFAPEKLATMKLLGAQLVIEPSPGGLTPDLIPRLQAIALDIAEREGAFRTDQFNNRDMLAGYGPLADELTEQVPKIDAFCAYVGTGGCFLGTTARLRIQHPALHRVVVEPAESAVLSGGQPGPHGIEGGGIGFRPPLLEPTTHDEVITVASQDAHEAARQLAMTDGILAGPSTGANILAARELADRMGPDATVATIQVDSGLKYLSTHTPA